MEPRWLNVRQAAAYMGYKSTKPVYSLLHKGAIERSPYRKGERSLVDRLSIDRYMGGGEIDHEQMGRAY